jgi:glycerol-3-phosphate dehydrogenase
LNTLSSKNRAKVINKMQSRIFDIAVIGGGITGAGIALDAASRGMKVALVEMKDFASGTSSKSTKLVHGGLRYLKQFEIALVREVGRERAIVHKLAPHLVTAEKMLLPIIKDGTYGKIGTSFGLMVYDYLADVEDEDKRRMLTKEEVEELEPLLRKDILEGGGIYAEYRTDDARLTIEIIKEAAEQGALSLNYVKAEEFIYDNKEVIGFRCRNLLENELFEIHSKFIVSAAGPWVDQLRTSDNSLTGKRLFHSKGAHLVVSRKRMPIKQAVYFDIPDGRMMFAIPRHRITYLGTTDTPYKGDIDQVYADRADANYILDAVNNMFPDVNLTIDDVESSWAGLRPLIFEEGKSASEMSRKDEIFESESGLISIAGGKLTGYRKMAQRVVDLVAKKYEEKYETDFGDCLTDKISLGGFHFIDQSEVAMYQLEITENALAKGLNEAQITYLVANYGKQTNIILAYFNYYNDSARVALARAELKFCFERELVFSLLDFFIRRTGRLFFNINSIFPVLDHILRDFQSEFGWTEDQVDSEKAKLLMAIKNNSDFSK